MPSARAREQVEQLERALGTLHRALAMTETPEIRDSVIKRFEYCFEMAWRAMHRLLGELGESVEQFAGAVLQAAFKARLIEDADVWKSIRDNRNRTSHTYSEKIAIEVAAFVRSTAAPEFERLLARLKAKL